jgi:putrescine---pyruvate transaminase
MRTPAFWHGYADMHAVAAGGELTIDRGEGSYVFDTDGRRYLDLSASLWYCLVGHGREELAEAAAGQMRRLEAYSTFTDLSNPPASALAERLAALAPLEDPAVFLTSGGSDSIDTAMKIARRFWHAQGEPGRTLFVARHGAYHGMHAGGTSLVGIEPLASGYGELLAGVRHVPWESLEAIEQLVEREGGDRIAAIFAEPIMGVGGVLAPPPGYLEGLERLCRRTGALLVADEVITGFGRVGSWFASERFGITPDLIVCAKGVTSGYLPLGAVIAGAPVADLFYDGTVGMWRHGYTYSGHATACAVALRNLQLIEDEGLLERAAWLERAIADALADVAAHELVAEVRAGVGALAAVRLEPEAIAAQPTLPASVAAALRDAGVLTRALVGGELQVSPPLVAAEPELELMVEGFQQALTRQTVGTRSGAR